MTDLVHALGLVIRRQRERQGWSQEQLAEHASLNRSYVGEIERGQVIASVVTIDKIAHALRVPVGALLADADSLTSALHTRRLHLAAIAC